MTLPGLAMARSIGDHLVKTVGVIPEPEVTKYAVKPGDDFLVAALEHARPRHLTPCPLPAPHPSPNPTVSGPDADPRPTPDQVMASDGVWEFIDSPEGVNIVAQFIEVSATEACTRLIETSAAKWRQVNPNPHSNPDPNPQLQLTQTLTLTLTLTRRRATTGTTSPPYASGSQTSPRTCRPERSRASSRAQSAERPAPAASSCSGKRACTGACTVHSAARVKYGGLGGGERQAQCLILVGRGSVKSLCKAADTSAIATPSAS